MWGERARALRGRIRPLVAIAASLALHALLLALLLSSERADAPRSELVSFDVELRSSPAPVAPVEPAAPSRRPTSARRPGVAGPGSSPAPRAAGPEAPVTGG